jgi:hypothetical protein
MISSFAPRNALPIITVLLLFYIFLITTHGTRFAFLSTRFAYI